MSDENSNFRCIGVTARHSESRRAVYFRMNLVLGNYGFAKIDGPIMTSRAENYRLREVFEDHDERRIILTYAQEALPMYEGFLPDVHLREIIFAGGTSTGHVDGLLEFENVGTSLKEKIFEDLHSKSLEEVTRQEFLEENRGPDSKRF